MFPGQGAQAVGMCGTICEEVPKARGKPRMVQLQIQPANGLTIHKVQALTIKDSVYGCLEGTV